MFKELLDRMEVVSLEDDDLKQVFSVDASGELATLEDYLIQSAPESVLAAFGYKLGRGLLAARGRAKVKSVRMLDSDELEPVVESYLDSVPEDEVLEIVGKGSFTSQELRREVKQRTAVGERLTEIVRQHNLFLEEAIKRGKIQRKREKKKISLPAFDF